MRLDTDMSTAQRHLGDSSEGEFEELATEASKEQRANTLMK